MIAIEWLKIIIGVVVGILLGSGATVLLYRMGFSKKKLELAHEIEKQEQEVQLMLGEAQKSGEQRKRELLLQAKEEIHRTKLDLERDTKERKSDLQKERQRIDQKETALDKKIEALEQKDNLLNERQQALLENEARVKSLEDEKVREIEAISRLSMEDARELVLENAAKTYRHDMAMLLKQMEAEAHEKAEETAKEIVVGAIQRYASDYVAETTVSVVNLPNDEMKGRIIGREGRNIRAIETITGVDLIIDDTPEAVILSCFNPIRRETARLTLEKLIQDGRIHPARIEEMATKAKKELNQIIKQEGEKAIFETGVIGVNTEIVKLLGRMHYRTSYGQNALQHSIEVSLLSGMIAGELGLDVELAKRAGLLHDIGKSVDFEMEGTHIELGANFARKHNEPETVVNAIESHHGNVEATSLISSIVAAADAISAARPGARRENLETYVKRIQRLEEIADSFEGVEKSFAIQAGRELRVMVIPEQMTEDEMILRAREICRQIEDELDYPGQIKVNMIRETRISDYAK